MPDDLEYSGGEKSWWVTLPGLVTAIAGLATAVGGLILVLSQTGVIGGNKADAAGTGLQPASPVPEDAKGVADTGGVSEEAPVKPASTPAPAPAPAPAPQTAGILRRDGERIDIRPGTFRHTMYGESLTLRSGQTIALDHVQQLDVLGSPDTDDFVTIAVVLTTGQTIKGQIAARFSFTGTNDVGPVDVRVSEIKTVNFGR